MSIVAGVDFGTLSVRVSIFDSVKGRSGRGRRRVPAVPQEGRSRLRHPEPRRSHAGAGRGHATGHRSGGHRRPRHRSHCARYHRVHCDSGRRPHAAAGRLLPVVRPPGVGGSRRNHHGGPPAGPGSHRLVRRHLLFRVGMGQAVALAAPQSRKARAVRQRLRALRLRGRGVVRHRRPGRCAAQRVRHGAQVDVARGRGRPAAGEFPRRRGSAAGGRSR